MGYPTVPIYRVALVREGRQSVAARCIASVEDAVSVFRDYIGDRDREVFAAMAISVKNEVIGVHTVSIGTLDSTLIHPRECFKPMILLNAASVIVAHNHPSGDPTPSAEDRVVTTRLVEAGKLLGIEVLDHLIVAGDKYTSLRELGAI